eukprot:scaffold33589_cov74-Phaeocystis_antarctica.AAC.2
MCTGEVVRMRARATKAWYAPERQVGSTLAGVFALPSRKGEYEAGRGAGREAGGMWDSVGVSGMHGKGPTEGSRGARARAERT